MLLAQAVVASLAFSQAVTHGKSSDVAHRALFLRAAHLFVAVVPAARNTSQIPHGLLPSMRLSESLKCI